MTNEHATVGDQRVGVDSILPALAARADRTDLRSWEAAAAGAGSLSPETVGDQVAEA